MKRIWQVVIAVVVVLAVGGGAFFGGTRYERSRILADPSVLFRQGMGRQFTGGQFPGGQFGPSAGGTPPAPVEGRGGTVGTIASIEGNALTVTKQDGSTVRVVTTDSTLIEKSMSVTVADLTVGERVIVSGAASEDGSITARSIQSQRAMAAPTPATP